MHILKWLLLEKFMKTRSLHREFWQFKIPPLANFDESLVSFKDMLLILLSSFKRLEGRRKTKKKWLGRVGDHKSTCKE